jgi:hypothetical protein
MAAPEMPDRVELPWGLVRREKPLVRFTTRERGQKFFDGLRHNGRQPDAALFGPRGEAWYCRGDRWASWCRDDGRRQREKSAEEEASA